jgi:hypothetical protein
MAVKLKLVCISDKLSNKNVTGVKRTRTPDRKALGTDSKLL